MAGNFNGTIYGDNVDFSGGTPIAGKVTTDGQLLIGATASPNIRVATLTEGTAIDITNGAGSITIAFDSSEVPEIPLSFPTDSGTATPALNSLTMAGSGSITTSGAGATVTTALTGLTDHAVLVGAGTSTITKVGPVASTGCVLMSNGVASDPGFSTATYPAVTTVSEILYSSATNTVTGLATANRGVLTTGATGVPAITALATDGQVIIGSTAGAPAAATLTAGGGISITNASNAITIASTGGGIAWTEVTGTSQNAAVNNAYIANNAGLVTITLPGTFAVGDIVWVVGKGTGLWVLDAPAGDTIHYGSQDTSSGGTITATNRYDAIQVVGTVANSEWTCTGVSQGNLTVA